MYILSLELSETKGKGVKSVRGGCSWLIRMSILLGEHHHLIGYMLRFKNIMLDVGYSWCKVHELFDNMCIVFERFV